MRDHTKDTLSVVVGVVGSIIIGLLLMVLVGAAIIHFGGALCGV